MSRGSAEACKRHGVIAGIHNSTAAYAATTQAAKPGVAPAY